MNNKNKTAGFIYEPMPNAMRDEAKERQTREQVERRRVAIWNSICKFREGGVTVETETELRQLTPKAVREQIEETRLRRLGEKFLPQTIRQTEEKAFSHMKRTLIPAAENLQSILKAVPFKIHVGESEAETFFDGDQTEDFIEQAATVPIPEEIVDYYEQLQKVCAAWFDLCQWCAAHQFEPPTSVILDDLRFDDDMHGCSLALSPERMFSLWKHGIVKPLSIEKEK